MMWRCVFFKTNKKIVASLAGTALLVALVVAASLWAFKQVAAAAEARKHTFTVINNADDLLSALRDAETGQRGYVLTGDKAFLEPYLAVRGRVDGLLGELRRLTAIRSAQERLDALVPLMDGKMAAMAQVIGLRGDHDMPAALALERGGQGKRLMDSIRAEMRGFIQIEAEELAQREATFQANIRRFFAIIVIASVFMLLFALLCVYLVYRETQHRLGDLLHLETSRLLELQEATNQRLQQAMAMSQVSEAKLAVTLNSIGDAVIATDAEGRLTLLNPLAEQLTGWARADAIGRPVEDVFHIINEATRQPSAIPVKETLAHGTVQGLANHTVLIAADGSERAIDDSCAPIRAGDGEVVGAVLVFRDVTERNRLDQALQDKNAELENANAVAGKAKEAAEIANRAKSAFLANMSHEIRTPMNAILGFSQLMLRDRGLTPQQSNHLQTINRSGEHLLALINDILEISKIEAGRATLNPAPFALNGMLEDVEALFKMRAGEKRLCFLVERVGDLPACVVGDENKLRQVLVNLIGNAVKFTNQGGVSVRVGVTSRSGTALRLMAEVEDTGAGIAEDELGKLFIPFEQAAGGKKIQAGTGLGLAISREFVRLMGGDISASSHLGKGSLFRFEINLEEGEAGAMAEKVESRRVLALATGQETRRVLVADDKADNRMLLTQMLGRIGFEVRAVADGERAVQEFDSWRPHLILMDTRMPEVNGFEAITRIRTRDGGEKVKIVSVTASAFDVDRKKALAIGADDFLGKPFREEVLLEKIRVLLRLEYVYDDEPETPSGDELPPEQVAALPETLLNQLHDATLSADMDRMLELIQQVEAHDPAIAASMKRLADNFEYQQLLEMTTRQPEGMK